MIVEVSKLQLPIQNVSDASQATGFSQNGFLNVFLINFEIF